MKKIVATLLAAIMMVSIAACGDNQGQSPSGSKPSAGSKTLMLDMVTPENGVLGIAAKEFKRLVEEKTDGRYTVEIYPNNQLSGGDQVKAMEMLQQGTIDVQIHGISMYSAMKPELFMLNMPWLFSSYDDVDAFLEGDKVDSVLNLLSECGVVPLAVCEGGFRNVSNNIKPIVSPEDIVGLKLRVPGVAAYIDFFKALGADPVAMNAGELYTAVQQGTVDGLENENNCYTDQKFGEVVKYLTVWNYSYDAYSLMLSQKVWSSLSAEDQAIFTECAKEAASVQRASVREINEEALKTCETEYGVEITVLSDDQIAAFKEAAKPFYDQYREVFGDELFKEFGLDT